MQFVGFYPEMKELVGGRTDRLTLGPEEQWSGLSLGFPEEDLNGSCGGFHLLNCDSVYPSRGVEGPGLSSVSGTLPAEEQRQSKLRLRKIRQRFRLS